MTPEEREDKLQKLEKLKKLKRLQELRAQKASLQASEPEEEQGALDSVRGGIQQFNRGAFSGFGDEIVGASRALIDKALPNYTYDFGADTSQEAPSLKDTYEMYRDDERNTMRQFEKENPKTALGLSVAGGFGNPLNRVAPGLGTTGTRLAKTIGATGRGLVEGALAGYGEGEGSLEDQLSSAGVGAAFGGGTGLGLAGVLGTASDIATKNRIGERLLQTVNGEKVFKPLNLADSEGWLGKAYRNVVGSAYGGGDIGKQESAYLRRALKRTGANVDDLLPDQVGTGRALDDITEEINNQKTRAKTRIKGEADRRQSAIEVAERRKVANLAEEVSRNTNEFRKRAAVEALPEEEVGRVLKDASPDDAQDMYTRLKQYWNKDAFREVKDRQFAWEGSVDKGLKQSIREMMSEDPGLAIEASNAISKISGLVGKLKKAGMSAEKGMAPEDFIEQMLASTKTIGIDGDALMELRNVFARSANKAATGRANRAIASQIDDLIIEQLDEKSAARFLDNKEKYTTFLSFRDAAKKASDTDGNFTVKQYRDAAKRYGDAASGDYPLNEVAAPLRAKERGLTLAEKVSKEKVKQSARAVKNTSKQKQLRQDQLAKAKKGLLKRESRGVLPEDQTFWSKFASTYGLGLGNPVQGVATAKLLSTPKAQTILAGQTEAQEALARLLKKADPDQYTNIISRFIALQSAGG